MHYRYCMNCKDWDQNIDKVTAPQMLAYARNPRPENEYQGKPFSHCPWCGWLLMHSVPTTADQLSPTRPEGSTAAED